MFKEISIILSIFLSLILVSEASEKSTWIPLFNGESLKSWQTKAKGDVNAVNNEIQIKTKKNMWLVFTEQEFTDFELEVEVCMPKGDYNSGIGFRIDNSGDKPKGYQCEIDKDKTGSVYALSSGWVSPTSNSDWEDFNKKAGNCFKADEWNKIRIVCSKQSIKIWVNQTLTTDTDDSKFSKGAIALQHHGKGGIHRFRNIRIKKL